jgi:hypothetical protein
MYFHETTNQLSISLQNYQSLCFHGKIFVIDKIVRNLLLETIFFQIGLKEISFKPILINVKYPLTCLGSSKINVWILGL